MFSEKIDWIQWYEYTGVFGGTLWILIINILLFKLLIFFLNKNKLKKQFIYILTALIIPIIISKFIFHQTNLSGELGKIFIMQPNIDPYDEKYKRSNLDNYNYLVNKLEKNEVKNSTIILPETYFSDAIQRDSYNLNNLTERLIDLKERFNSEILTGIELFDIITDSSQIKDYSNDLKDGRWLNLYNLSLIHI